MTDNVIKVIKPAAKDLQSVLAVDERYNSEKTLPLGKTSKLLYEYP